MNGTTFQFNILTQMLDAAAMRHRVIANNVANLNTPNYKRLEVSFEQDLARAIDSQADTSTVQPRIFEDPSAPARVDGNTVDIDREMNEMNRNSVLYESVAQILASRISSLKAAIKGS